MILVFNLKNTLNELMTNSNLLMNQEIKTTNAFASLHRNLCCMMCCLMMPRKVVENIC